MTGMRSELQNKLRQRVFSGAVFGLNLEKIALWENCTASKHRLTVGNSVDLGTGFPFRLWGFRV